MEPLLEMKDVTKKRGNHFRLKIPFFSIMPGEIIALEGQNGAGKSTFLKLAAGLLHPDEGRLSTGEGITTFYFPEKVVFFERLSSSRYFEMIKGFRGEEPEICNKTKKFAGDIFGQRISVLSKGMKKKLALAAGLAGKTRLHLWDEPFSELDSSSLEELILIVLDRARQGCGFIIASHLRTVLEKVATRLARLEPCAAEKKEKAFSLREFPDRK